MAKTFIIHDESLNTKGFWMLTAGCDLTQFKKNPIMLWDHNRSYGSREERLPIGHWENIRIKGSQILADAVFDSDEFSQTIARKVEEGTLRMASAGAKPIETSTDAKYIKQGQRYETVLKWKMQEASIVNRGANENALTVELYDDDNNIIELSDSGNSPLKELNQISNKNDKNMNGVKSLLKLSADASEQDVLNAISPLIKLSDEVKTLTDTNVTLTEENTRLQAELDKIELADKEEKTEKATNLIAEALKDGRLSDDAEKSTSTFWLSAFESNFNLAEKNLANLPKRKSVTYELSDEPSESAFAKRQREIEQNINNKKK